MENNFVEIHNSSRSEERYVLSMELIYNTSIQTGEYIEIIIKNKIQQFCFNV